MSMAGKEKKRIAGEDESISTRGGRKACVQGVWGHTEEGEMAEMSWKGMFTEDHVCQGNETGLFPSVGDGQPAEGFKQGNDMNRCFTHIYALKARRSALMEINP